MAFSAEEQINQLKEKRKAEEREETKWGACTTRSKKNCSELHSAVNVLQIVFKGLEMIAIISVLLLRKKVLTYMIRRRRSL